jgi:hypothetical protein
MADKLSLSSPHPKEWLQTKDIPTPVPDDSSAEIKSDDEAQDLPIPSKVRQRDEAISTRSPL